MEWIAFAVWMFMMGGVYFLSRRITNKMLDRVKVINQSQKEIRIYKRNGNLTRLHQLCHTEDEKDVG